MAIVSDNPSFRFDSVDKKVAIPSGILCSIIASIDIIPILYSSPSLFGVTYLSIVIDSIIPIHINMSVRIIVGNILNVVCRYVIVSGIKSIIDTVIITPDAKLSDAAIILLLLFLFINIIIVPISVDRPASVVNINPILVFTISPFNYMKKRLF